LNWRQPLPVGVKRLPYSRAVQVSSGASTNEAVPQSIVEACMSPMDNGAECLLVVRHSGPPDVNL
jgi:hypothetical protein